MTMNRTEDDSKKKMEPPEEEFMALANKFNLIPVFCSTPLGDLTPIDLYKKLSNESPCSVLLESGERGAFSGRYSFIATDPLRIFKSVAKNRTRESKHYSDIDFAEYDKGFLQRLRYFMQNIKAPRVPGLPPFTGGAVGFLGYEMTEEHEDLFHNTPDKFLPRAAYPSAIFMIAGSIAAIDNVDRTLIIIENIPIPPTSSDDSLRELYHAASEKIAQKISMATSSGGEPKHVSSSSSFPVHQMLAPQRSREEFMEMVENAKEYIRNGDAYQIVMSQKFSAPLFLPPLELYESLKLENPSPYMFFISFPEITVLGASPEVLVKVQGQKAIIRPLAGTRRRGATLTEDLTLEEELIHDSKECSEHVMLVDLARNDLYRICRPESVTVTSFQEVERYSKVMHLSSQVEGVLSGQSTSMDALGSAFPAGTLTGAPKIRAMEIISELEKEARGVYGGAVGYIDFNGNIDTCIAIRTFVVYDNTLSLQVGAGIVADSNPESEHQECINKGKALFKVIEKAIAKLEQNRGGEIA